MAQFFVIFFHLVKLSLLKQKNFVTNSLFFLSFLIIFILTISPLSQGSESNLESYKLKQGLLVCASVFALLFSLLANSFEFLKEDFNDGTLEQMQIRCVNFEIFVLAKILSNWLNHCLVNVFLAVILSLVFGHFEQFIYQFFWIFLLSSLLINFLCCFAGSLAILGGSISLIAFVVMPLVLPIIIFSSLSVMNNYSQFLNILLSLNIFLIPLLTFASSALIRVALD